MMFTFWAGILSCVRLLVVDDEFRLALFAQAGFEE
jgi:hypothetical protein